MIIFQTFPTKNILYLYDISSLKKEKTVLLVEENGVHRENHGSATIRWQNVSHTVVSSTPRHERDLNSQHYISSCKFNYHTITTTTGSYTLLFISLVIWVYVSVRS
jgi:hypothetical protein